MIINLKKDGTKYKRSSLERQFENLWKSHYPQIDLEVEARLIPNRQYRCDYVHRESKTVIEIAGGTYLGSKGGHSSASGIRKDYEKNNLLLLEGYRTFFLGTGQITLKNVRMIGEFLLSMKG